MDIFGEQDVCLQRTLAYTYLMMLHYMICATGFKSVHNKYVPAALSCVATTPSRILCQRSQRKLRSLKKAGHQRLVTRHHVTKCEVSALYTAPDKNDYTLLQAHTADGNRSCHSCTQYILHMPWCVYVKLRKPTYGCESPKSCPDAPSVAYPACTAVSRLLPKIFTN